MRAYFTQLFINGVNKAKYKGNIVFMLRKDSKGILEGIEELNN
jgi:hypothetical protein